MKHISLLKKHGFISMSDTKKMQESITHGYDRTGNAGIICFYTVKYRESIKLKHHDKI
jgi:hypothetical protein